MDKRQELQGCKTKWQVVMLPGKRKALDLKQAQHKLLDKAEKTKASVRAKVEHPFRVIKQQFGDARLRYRCVQKNTHRLMMLFALGNLWMTRKRIMGLQA